MNDYNLGFLPVYDKNSKVLILGSFPSVVSRINNFYYGNKQNRFWKVLENIFKEKIGVTNEEKINFLLNHNLALWDVVKRCNIKGSSDSKINLKNSVPNDIKLLLEKTPNIHLIICNGKKSYELLNIHFKNLGIKTICLPSTSSANTRFDFSIWENALKELI